MRLLNPLIFVLLIVLLGWSVRVMAQEEDIATWLVASYGSLLAVGLIVNLAIIIARGFAKRAAFGYWGWLMAYFIVACWILSGSVPLFSLPQIHRDFDADKISFTSPELQQGEAQVQARDFLSLVVAGDKDSVAAQCPARYAIDSEPAIIAAALAIEYRRPQLLAYFLDQGLSPNARYEENTLLSLAVNASRLNDVRALLKRGADANLPDAESNTPLIIAALLQSKQLISLLLEAGADPSIKNQDGYSAADYTTREDLLELLTEA